MTEECEYALRGIKGKIIQHDHESCVAIYIQHFSSSQQAMKGWHFSLQKEEGHKENIYVKVQIQEMKGK